MKCWVCHRQARGYGHTDNRFKVGESRRYSQDWAFCSRRCQDAFHALYGAWRKSGPSSSDTLTREALMIDISSIEQQAMRRCLRPFGESAGEIGFDKPLGHYSEQEAMRVIDAIVTSYVEAMTLAHENMRYPAIRLAGQDLPRSCADPFADMADNIPWEA